MVPVLALSSAAPGTPGEEITRWGAAGSWLVAGGPGPVWSHREGARALGGEGDCTLKGAKPGPRAGVQRVRLQGGWPRKSEPLGSVGGQRGQEGVLWNRAATSLDAALARSPCSQGGGVGVTGWRQDGQDIL